MPRRPLFPSSLIAHVRHHFGLTQADLALYLGVSPAFVQHAETGYRRLTADVYDALRPLAAGLPAPGETRRAALPN